MPGNPEYDTAGNIALFPEADPKYIEKVSQYFNLNLDTIVTIEPIDDHKLSLGFIQPLTIRKLLTNHIDLQHKITKGILKKLAKFPSENQQYFQDNSSHKTTDEYKRISEKEETTLFASLD